MTYNLRLVRVANWTVRRGCAPPYAMAEADERPGERVALSIGTFNVLAPCHKRERAARFERGEGDTGRVQSPRPVYNTVVGCACECIVL